MAYCSSPSFSENAPSAPGGEPNSPYCLSGYRYSRTHTCESYEIDRYVNEINDYIRELNQYANEANNFAQAAIDFANEASAFARCKADEAKEDIE